jgi:hypothetical protein
LPPTGIEIPARSLDGRRALGEWDHLVNLRKAITKVSDDLVDGICRTSKLRSLSRGYDIWLDGSAVETAQRHSRRPSRRSCRAWNIQRGADNALLR